jgi:hypothetical protein
MLMVDGIVVFVAVSSLFGRRRILWMRVPRLHLVDWIVILANCFVLNLLMMPVVKASG